MTSQFLRIAGTHEVLEVVESCPISGLAKVIYHGKTLQIPNEHLQIIAAQEGEPPESRNGDVVWLKEVGLVVPGSVVAHFANESVGDLYQKKRKRGGGDERD